MTPVVSVGIKPETLARAMRELGDVPKDIRLATTRALNRIADMANTRIVRGIASEANIKQKEIRKEVKTVRATAGKPLAKVVITGKRIPLIAFSASQNKKGVRYRIGKSGGRSFIAHAFIQTVKAGKTGFHEGVFIRKKGYGRQHAGLKARLKFKLGIGRRTTAGGLVPRYPIQQLFGPSVVGVYQNAPALMDAVWAEATEGLDARMNHEVDYIISKRGLRAAAA